MIIETVIFFDIGTILLLALEFFLRRSVGINPDLPPALARKTVMTTLEKLPLQGITANKIKFI